VRIVAFRVSVNTISYLEVTLTLTIEDFEQAQRNNRAAVGKDFRKEIVDQPRNI
jgi:hypothetical protein